MRLHITYASVRHLRPNQLITCASHDLIPITARGILLFAHSSYMFVVVIVVVGHIRA
jgi:hypothetical protein